MWDMTQYKGLATSRWVLDATTSSGLTIDTTVPGWAIATSGITGMFPAVSAGRALAIFLELKDFTASGRSGDVSLNLGNAKLVWGAAGMRVVSSAGAATSRDVPTGGMKNADWGMRLQDGVLQGHFGGVMVEIPAGDAETSALLPTLTAGSNTVRVRQMVLTVVWPVSGGTVTQALAQPTGGDATTGALQLAQTAQTTAEAAQTTANTAKSTADAAKTAADSAKTTADSAKASVGQAEQAASAAQSVATSAKGTADTAQAAATRAQSAAEAAQATANTAKSTADAGKSTADGLVPRVSAVEARALDTGWRDVTSLLSSARTSGRILVRRMGNQVRFVFESLVLTAAGSGTMLVLPVGFRPAFIEFAVIFGVTGRVQVTMYGNVQVYNWEAGKPIMGSIDFTCDEAFPAATAYPGNPA